LNRSKSTEFLKKGNKNEMSLSPSSTRKPRARSNKVPFKKVSEKGRARASPQG